MGWPRRMIYLIKRKANTVDVIDLDIFSLGKKLKPYIANEVSILQYLRDQPYENYKLSDIWPDELECHFIDDSENTHGDINSLDGVLVLNTRAYEILKDSLEDYGEFLKVRADGVLLIVFSPLVFGNENIELCEKEYIDGIEVGYKSIVFNDDVEDKLIFKSKLSGCSILYCNERLKNIIEENSLTGISFDSEINNIY